MGLFDFFKKNKKEEEPLNLNDLTLKNIKVGYYLTYDMKTWEVTDYNLYDWGKDDITHEWQLTSANDVIFLEKESDDQDFYGIYRKIDFGNLDKGIAKYIQEHDDPPDTIKYENVEYSLEQMSGGHFLKNGRGPKEPLLSWTYEDENAQNYLIIEQWGENDFDACIGQPVEEYQFTDILPGAKKS